MASRSLGALTLDLVVKTGAFVQGMTAAERAANKSLSAIEKRAYSFGSAIGSAIKVGAVAATAALVALTKSAIDNADALRDSSIQLGISTETLSAYGYAAQQTGTDLDGLSRGLKILSKNAADAIKPTSEQAKIFNALGISVTDTEGQLRKLDDLIPDIADAFRSMEDGTQKAALAQALFGKSGLELIEFLNSGSQGLDEFTEKARALGIIVGTDTANAADEFNDKLADLRAQVSGFGNQLAAELLPRLIELIDYFSQSTQKGELLGVTVKQVGELFDFLFVELKKADEVGKSFTTTMGGIATYIGLVKQAFKDLFSLNVSGFFTNAVSAAKQAYQNLQSSFGNVADFSGVTSRVIGATATNARGGSNRPETGGRNINYNALSNALAGVGGGGGSKAAKAAKDDVDKLGEAYKRLIATANERIALFGKEGEAAKVAYDLESGELAGLSQARKDEILGLYQKIDAMEQMQELQDAADKAAEKESKRIKDALADNDDLIAAMQFEYDLLGMTNRERERELALRQLNVDATDEQRAAVGQLADAYTEMQETISVMDDIREGFSDFFSDVLTGTKSVKEAFKDMLDDIQKRILDRIAQNWVDQLFGQQGTSSGGASSGGGTNWLALIGSLFGGGRASGGDVQPWKLYRVNESGMEGLTVGGQDYLMTGSRGGTVTPAHKMGGGGGMVVQHFHNPVLGSRNSTQQIQQEAYIKQRIAAGRNS